MTISYTHTHPIRSIQSTNTFILVISFDCLPYSIKEGYAHFTDAETHLRGEATWLGSSSCSVVAPEFHTLASLYFPPPANTHF